ncbi:MAG: DUF2975 domain-containing protein [Ruminococcaceae bacterium]|nr:DUF2975 domain-containing protein [Oscillospiraceae bacterium]
MSDKKMVNAAKNWDTGAKVCDGIFRAFGIVFIVFALLVLIFGSKMYEAGSFTLDLDFIKLYLADEYQMAPASMQVFTVLGLAVMSVVCFLTSYGIKQLRAILMPMKEGRPFEEIVPKKLRNIAWTVLAGGIILQVIALAERMILTSAYPMEQIFSSPAIAGIEYSYSFDFTFVFIFCIIMFLSYIFNYGQKLQQESDETL